MHSSTSSLDIPARRLLSRVTRETWALLACVFLLYGAAEGVARVGLQRVSRIHRRILEEAATARQLRRSTGGQGETVLFAGNSLLLEGLHMDLLKAGLQPRYQPHRYIVEQTSYFDWFYGLQRLFREGMRPDAVVLCLNPPQFTSSSIRGDFSAHMLFDLQDIWPASRDSHADLTRTSSYYLAYYSAFYATRAELRSVFMYRIAPPVVAMWLQAGAKPAVIPPDGQVTGGMASRLRNLADLCARNGARFLFLIPPTRQPGDTAMVTAGQQAGVTVLRPIPSMSLSADYYRDGFHLNANGATEFTNAIVNDLMK